MFFHPSIKFVTILSVLVSFNIKVALAQDTPDINDFIERVKVKTFDCPNSELMPQLNRFLDSDSIPQDARFQLGAEKTHWLICTGNFSEAQTEIDKLLADPQADQSQYYYASSVYQKGFIYDVQEDQKRCDYYAQARELSKEKHDDISLSAELGLMTYCEEEISEGEKLARLYQLLEKYSFRGDQPTVAHIHNQIGLLYGRIGQHVLAAEQFWKTYELGFEHYEGANKYASLISVFTSLIASSQYEEALKVIDLLNTAREEELGNLVHAWYYYALGRYHQSLQNGPALKEVVRNWKAYFEGMETSIYAGMHRWFKTEVCIYEEDLACLGGFVVEEESKGPASLSFMRGNADHLSLLARAHLALGDQAKAKYYLDTFSQQMRIKLANNQSSGKVLGVASLYSKIDELETDLNIAKLNRERVIYISIGIVLSVILFFAFAFHRKQLEAQSYDSVTKLLNSQAARTKIKKVSAPSGNKSNALALFDLGNFKEVNRLLGSSNADEALQQIAMTFKNITRESDILGRIAPEQFLLCLTDIEEETAKSFFQRIQFALQNTNLGVSKGINISVRSSMSIYVTTKTFHDLDDVIDDMTLSLSLQSEQPNNT